VRDSFRIGEKLINAATQQLGQKYVLTKLRGFDWHLNTWFAGSLFAELGAESFVAKATEYVESNSGGLPRSSPVLRWGPAIDQASSTTKLVQNIWGNRRCVLGPKAESLVKLSGKKKLQKLHVKRLHVAAQDAELQPGICSVHGKACAADFAGPATACSIDFATFPCPPFSRQGKRKQMLDPRFITFKAWAVSALKRAPDVVVGENVVGVPTSLLSDTFPGYTVKTCILDSRTLGLPMARDRVIFIGVKDGCRRWVDHGKNLPELIWMVAGTQEASITPSRRPHLQAHDYFELPDSACLAQLTDAEAHLHCVQLVCACVSVCKSSERQTFNFQVADLKSCMATCDLGVELCLLHCVVS
jgi:hypothetical protein